MGPREFVALAAFMMALFGLSINAALPALTAIRNDLGLAGNDAQLIVTAIILGMALGQPFYGPLSDAIGRKPAMYGGLAVFGAGCILSMFATGLPMLLAGRFVQGFGVSGPRVVTLALIRDQYQGKSMARVMSSVTAVMMIGPVVAPLMGAAVLKIGDWRAIFAALMFVGATAFAWLATRQPETLKPENRVDLSWRMSLEAAREVFTTRSAIGYSIASGLSLGMLFGWVGAAPQLFADIYNIEDWFPVIFASLAPAIAVGSIANRSLLERMSMTSICEAATVVIVAVSITLLVLYRHGTPPHLVVTIAYVGAMLFLLGVQFGNLNTLALADVGHIAGSASGISGSIGWMLGALVGTLIGHLFDGTVRPTVAGFAVFGAVSFATIRSTARTRRTARPRRSGQGQRPSR